MVTFRRYVILMVLVFVFACICANAHGNDLLDVAMTDVVIESGNASEHVLPVNILWLPLGDSITFGCGTDAAPRAKPVCARDAGGYRVPLAWALSQQGYNITTMGTLRTGPSYAPAQWQAHEGHPGITFDKIDQLLEKSLRTSASPPDMITIHLGTNDCGHGADVPTINKRFMSLLSHIFAKVPTANVFIASVISNPGKVTCIDSFNKGLSGYVAKFKATGMRIHYVPMQEWSGVCTFGGTEDPLSGLCGSGKVHPTAAGYLRMASAFALAIAESGAFAKQQDSVYIV